MNRVMRESRVRSGMSFSRIASARASFPTRYRVLGLGEVSV